MTFTCLFVHRFSKWWGVWHLRSAVAERERTACLRVPERFRGRAGQHIRHTLPASWTLEHHLILSRQHSLVIQ